MKNLQEKEKNLTPGKLTFTSTPPRKSFGPKTLLRLLLLVFGLAIAAGVVWLLFALNRPGIEIKASNSPLVATAARTTQSTQPVVAQATASTPAQMPTPTQVIAVQNSGSRPTQPPALGPTQTPSRTNSGSAAQVPTPVIGTSTSQIQGYGVVTSKELNVRSAPNTDATVIKSFKSGDIVELVSRSGGWYQTVEGSWISASFLEVRQTRSEAESYAREIASS